VKRGPTIPLEQQIALAKLPAPVLEHKFHPVRRWRFDLSWPDRKLACEIEGAVWVQGRHTRGSGFVKDIEKYSEAAILGWKLIRVTTQQVRNGQALNLIERALRGH
jgi:hypothetical protein